ncbi:hypothetical protein [Pseudomonas sp. RIT-PI-r]|jgi:hypothetical protein|uniref:hypothetical protein n=1 Tax=Pseudomonas sp. RIT-PI-r TaxID=1699620 RepID=UPI0006D6C6F4|nr:hypothetical protein [Pseudomonas sp. RIT-PI-r]KPG94487.1 hypothetical protein AK821_19985 [Pseudomonas sp. RIT-PI-r]
MISKFKITVGIENTSRQIELLCDNEAISITLKLDNQPPKTYIDKNFYKCFGLLRKDNSHITFFCKGSKINVHPSSMSSQMSLGLKAYELTPGLEASMEDLVFIFDYDNENLTNCPEEQKDFFLNWLKS